MKFCDVDLLLSKIYEGVVKSDAEEGNYRSTTYNTLF
jgi:hypothetical protein